MRTQHSEFTKDSHIHFLIEGSEPSRQAGIISSILSGRPSQSHIPDWWSRDLLTQGRPHSITLPPSLGQGPPCPLRRLHFLALDLRKWLHSLVNQAPGQILIQLMATKPEVALRSNWKALIPPLPLSFSPADPWPGPSLLHGFRSSLLPLHLKEWAWQWRG